jgi:hypothetical protein
MAMVNRLKLLPHYDFVVFGEHPAALWATIILLEQGLKVLVLPFQQNRIRDWVPQLVIDQLKIPARNLLDAQEIQVLTPSRRFRVYTDPADFAAELAFVGGEKLPDLWRGLAYLFRGFEGGPTFPEEWSSISSKLREVKFLTAQSSVLTQHFFEKIESLGGHILEKGACQQIFVEKKAFTGVQIAGSSTVISAAQAIIGVNWEVLKPLFSSAIPVESKPAGWFFEMSVKVSPDALPVGLSAKMIYSEAGAPIVEIDQISPGQFRLCTLLPFQEHTLQREFQRKTAQRLLKLLGMIVPDLEYNLNSVKPDIRDPEKTERVDLVDQYPFRMLSQIPGALLGYAIPGLGNSSVIPGVYTVYEEVNPRLGEWGAYQAAYLALTDWAKKTQKPEFLKEITQPII